MVHLLIFLVIDLIEKLLPMVIEVIEKFLVVDHLGLSIEEHGGGLTEVLASVEPVTHAVIVKTFTSIFEDVDTIDGKRLGGLEQDLLGMEESLSHSLNLLVIVVINLAAVVKHVTDIRDGESELINDLGGSSRSLPKAMVLGELSGCPVGVGPSTGSRGVHPGRPHR